MSRVRGFTALTGRARPYRWVRGVFRGRAGHAPPATAKDSNGACRVCPVERRTIETEGKYGEIEHHGYREVKVRPVILAGGSGTRLWPLSREYYPKPLLALGTQRPLIQEAICRLDGLPEVSAPILVCNEEHRFLVAEQLRSLDRSDGLILLEPVGRNTAPALALAAHAALAEGEDEILVVMPADQVILDAGAFREAVVTGARLAGQGRLVTFGIVPVCPETGYGYLRKGAPLDGADAFELARFVEKPDRPTAEGYLDSGEYLWNSGIFMMRASHWLEELEAHRPDIAAAVERAWRGGERDEDFYRAAKADFIACPADSIDYAVMEKVGGGVVVPLDADWSDVGSWPALWEICPRDAEGNVTQGDVLAEGVRDSLMISQHRLLAAVGVTDLMIVETADAVLVVHRDHAQRVKDIVQRLKEQGRDEHKVHRTVHRPWGAYERICNGARFQVKRITVKPGASLSLQMHHHRAEHWIVVTGTARVTCGDEVFLLGENESTYIPLGTRHRLENPGSIALEIIEVQSGSYLGEDDIVRFEDRYKRC
ncbi:mannose-1-phosphate guanylyltransferase 1 [bacterium BMS3Abin12]|nr:mannose-1-phosphate guanylyltransferase 1 [bacterium BMS3Abin12]